MLRLYGQGRRKAAEASGGVGVSSSSSGVSGAATSSEGSLGVAAAAAEAAAAAAPAAAGPRVLPSDIRLQKDLEDLDLPPNCSFYCVPAESWEGGPPGGSGGGLPPMDGREGGPPTFLLVLRPDEGFWRGGTVRFELRLPNNYPHEPPRIYHPNIDLQGNVCLNILREDWKPVLSLSSVIYGILHLFLHISAAASATALLVLLLLLLLLRVTTAATAASAGGGRLLLLMRYDAEQQQQQNKKRGEASEG
ncbi:hypothetical protein Esti_006451 [Eimeria stiedai]